MRHLFPLPPRAPFRGIATGLGFAMAGLAKRAIAAEALSTHTIFNPSPGASLARLGRLILPAPPPLIRALALPAVAALRARRFIHDNADVDRRPPPGRNPRGRRQGKPDRGA